MDRSHGLVKSKLRPMNAVFLLTRGLFAELGEDAFFAELPAALQTDIAHELARPLLQQSDVFSCLTPSAQRVLAARLRPLAVPAGHNVAQEGDTATVIWLLQEGERCSLASKIAACQTPISACLVTFNIGFLCASTQARLAHVSR